MDNETCARLLWCLSCLVRSPESRADARTCILRRRRCQLLPGCIFSIIQTGSLRERVGRASESGGHSEKMAPSPSAKLELDAQRARYEALLSRHAAWARVEAGAHPELNAVVARVHRAERRRRKRAEARRRTGCACPITLEEVSVLRDPIVMSDGHVYDRDAMATWLGRTTRSPVTREALAPWGVTLSRARAAVARAAA